MTSGGGVPFDAAIRDLLKGGYTARFQATGDSMNPAIASGEYVHVEPCSGSDVRRGEVLLIDASRGLTAHRLVRVRRSADGEVRLTTRGDNALWNDRPVRPAQVLGKVIGVERHGRVVRVLEECTLLHNYARALVRRVLGTLQRLRAR